MKTVLDAKNSIDRCNSEIINAVEKIANELRTMDRTLSTPNSKKTIALHQEYVDGELAYLKSTKDTFNNSFNIIGMEYHNYSDNVGRTVGDK